jgi:hypothetical protein
VDAARGGPYVTAVSVTAEPETNDQTPAASPSPWNQADRGLREAGDDRRQRAALWLNGARLLQQEQKWELQLLLDVLIGNSQSHAVFPVPGRQTP